MKSTTKFVLLSKVEGTYGQDATPGAADMVICSDPKWAVQADKLTRNIARSTLTPQLSRKGGKSQTLGFGVELMGGGLDGATLQAPAWEPLMLSCGMARTDVVLLTVDDVTGFAVGETVEGVTSSATGVVRRVLDETDKVLVLEQVVGSFAVAETVNDGGAATATVSAVAPGIEYRPMSDPDTMQASTNYFWRDGIKHALLGTRGSFSLDLKAGQVGMLNFSLTGMWVDPADASMPAITAGELVPPLIESLELKLGSYAPIAEALQFDLANNVVRRPSVNAAEGVLGIVINDRAPKGSLNPETVSLGTWNPWPLWKASTGQAMRCQVGSAPGSRIRLDWTKVALDEIGYGERDKALTYEIPLEFSGVAGDDEIIITVS